MRTPQRGIVAAVVVTLNCLAVADDRHPENDADAKFVELDVNHDKLVSLDELLSGRQVAADITRRDLLLFDQNQDGSLDRREFSTLPDEFDPEQRGSLPDPIENLVDQAVEAMDESFADWSQEPEKQIDARQFIRDFVATVGNNVAQPQTREADENGDGRVSRAEARRFIEIQLGVRRRQGELLREPNGRVVNFVDYLSIDANRDDRLDHHEFLTHSAFGGQAEAVFRQADTDADDAISFDEWRQLPDHGLADPVEDFRRLDQNLDARVDADELAAGSPDELSSLSSRGFRGFDTDRDGLLTLAEYRASMLANPLIPWQQVLCDRDRDGLLSFSEFNFGSPGAMTLEFPLLRWIYFQTLDVNENGHLDPDEFAFRPMQSIELFSLNEDGTGWRSVLKMKDFPKLGSPDVSRDGKRIVFDAWRNNLQEMTIFVVNIDGGTPLRVGRGFMPTWSASGGRLACSRGGVRIIDLGGTTHKLVDGRGWSAQWSPDGKQIAFTQGRLIRVYNVQSETTRTVLGANAHRYSRIRYNMSWSPDGRSLCLKGQRRDGVLEVATLDVSGREIELKVHATTRDSVASDSAWHPSGKRIVFSMPCAQRQCQQLYEFDPNQDKPPKLVEGQDPTRNNREMCWTPDGKRLILTSGDS